MGVTGRYVGGSQGLPGSAPDVRTKDQEKCRSGVRGVNLNVGLSVGVGDGRDEKSAAGGERSLVSCADTRSRDNREKAQGVGCSRSEKQKKGRRWRSEIVSRAVCHP